MTNEEKYKTAGERREAYRNYCEECRRTDGILKDEFDWLQCKYTKVKPLPCPFCGGKAIAVNAIAYGVVMCKSCETRLTKVTVDMAIDAWNRRAK